MRNAAQRPEREGWRTPRHTPHPRDTPIDPYDPRSLHDEPGTPFKRGLIGVSGTIRSAEAQMQRYCRRLGVSIGKDPRKVVINPQQIMVRNPAAWQHAKSAKTAQQNIESAYRKWAQLCEKHLQAIETKTR